MKKTLLILALPFLTATAFAQTASMSASASASAMAKPMPAGARTRADVKEEAKSAPKSSKGDNADLQSVNAGSAKSSTTRKEVRDETKRAGAAGELKSNGELDSIKVAPTGNSTTRADVKAEASKDKMAKKASKKTPGDEPSGK